LNREGGRAGREPAPCLFAWIDTGPAMLPVTVTCATPDEAVRVPSPVSRAGAAGLGEDDVRSELSEVTRCADVLNGPRSASCRPELTALVLDGKTSFVAAPTAIVTLPELPAFAVRRGRRERTARCVAGVGKPSPSVDSRRRRR